MDSMTHAKQASRRRRQGYDDIAIVSPVTIPYVRYSIKSAHWWVARGLSALLKRSGLAKEQIDGACITSFMLSPDTAVGLMQHIGLAPRWLDHIPTGGASGVIGIRRAARAVQAGDADIVACVSADTNDVHSFRLMISNFSQFARDAVYPYGSGGPNASFALLTAYYMREFGATREDFGKLCVAQRDNALAFPWALFKKPLSLEQYMKARPITDPLHLFDCVMPCAGAEAFLVMRVEQAEALGLPYARVLGTIERHNAFADDPIQMRGGWEMDRDDLYDQAEVGPDAIDFMQTYDDYPVITAMQFEDLGFCEKGGASDFIRQHTFDNKGSFPLNTSGGQLSVGQAGAAGGYLGTVEAIRQLTGERLGSAVPDAKLGLVCGFGMINYDRGVCSSAAILSVGKQLDAAASAQYREHMIETYVPEADSPTRYAQAAADAEVTRFDAAGVSS